MGGTKITFPGEATDITGVEKDPKTEKLLQLPMSKKLAELKMAHTTKLGMIQDSVHMQHIHAAYIQGSVPTAVQESREIMNLTFPDEREGADGIQYQPTAHITGTKITFPGEATDITGVEKDNTPRVLKSVRGSKLLQLKKRQAALQKAARKP